jgi:hypothetical protein
MRPERETSHGFIGMCLLVFTVIVGGGCGTDDRSEVARLLDIERQSIRNHHVDTCNPFCDHEISKALDCLGPNALPDLMAAIEREDAQNELMFNFMASSVLNISVFAPYAYVPKTEATEANKMFHDFDEEHIPVLSRVPPSWQIDDVSRGYVMLPEPPSREALVRWWNMRASFVKREGVAERIVQLTHELDVASGSNGSPDAKAQVERKMEKEMFVYGIYNLPYFIEAIAQFNDLFSFQYVCGRWRFICDDHIPKFRDDPDKVCITAKQKLALVVGLWQEAKEKYSKMSELYEAIETALGKYAADVKEIETPLVPGVYVPISEVAYMYRHGQLLPPRANASPVDYMPQPTGTGR